MFPFSAILYIITYCVEKVKGRIDYAPADISFASFLVVNDAIYWSPLSIFSSYKADIKSTYDVSVMIYRDIITDLIGLMNTHTASIDQLVNSIDENELNKALEDQNESFSELLELEAKFCK